MLEKQIPYKIKVYNSIKDDIISENLSWRCVE